MESAKAEWVCGIVSVVSLALTVAYAVQVLRDVWR